ncbi:hypothetical protein FORC065_0115 [Yersinia enterocolitica]|nr:hypothetical protein FORC065_0115 [Yersinia enterocolitica]
MLRYKVLFARVDNISRRKTVYHRVAQTDGDTYCLDCLVP